MDIAARIVNVAPVSSSAAEQARLDELARGEPQAFETLVELYGVRVQALASRLLGWSGDAEDITQDVFLALLRKGPGFCAERSVWPYLATVTVNRCRTVQRRKWLHQRFLRVFVPIRKVESPAKLHAEVDGSAQVIRDAIAGLPIKLREVVVLHYFEDLSTVEVANVLSLRPNTVEVRLCRAREALEEKLAGFVD